MFVVFLFENWKFWWVMKLFACQKVSRKWKDCSHVFFLRADFVLLALRATENYAFETSLFPFIYNHRHQGAEISSNCYMSESTIKSSGGFLKYWLNTVLTSQTFIPFSFVFTSLRKLFHFSLIFYFWDESQI